MIDALPSRTQVAYHEAGHAVAALALGWSAHDLTLSMDAVPVDGVLTLGVCNVGSPPTLTLPAFIYDRGGYRARTPAELDAKFGATVAKQGAIVFAAALAAEALFIRGEVRPSDMLDLGMRPTVVGSDFDRILRWAGMRAPGEPIDVGVLGRFERVYMQAARLIAKPAAWRAVRVLATELERRGEVGGVEATAYLAARGRQRK